MRNCGTPFVGLTPGPSKLSLSVAARLKAGPPFSRFLAGAQKKKSAMTIRVDVQISRREESGGFGRAFFEGLGLKEDRLCVPTAFGARTPDQHQYEMTLVLL